MLDAYIIDEMRRREEKERAMAEQPRLELPLESPREWGEGPAPIREGDRDTHQRSVIVIDL